MQRHMKLVLAVSLSTWFILLCSTVPVSTLVLSVNIVSGEIPEEPYREVCSQLLMLAVLDFSSCPRPPLWTDFDCHRQLLSSTTLSPMIVLPKGKFYSVLLWCGRGNRLGIFTPDLATIHITCSAHDGQSPQMLISQCMDSQKPLPAPLADLILRVKGHRPESSQDRRSILSPSYWSDLTVLIRRPNLASSSSRQCSVPAPYMIFLKLKSFSLSNLSFLDKFVQNSSRQSRERSLSTSSFSKERIFPMISLSLRGDSLPELKTGKSYKFPTRLLSYVNVHLEPVDATILIVMRVEVLDGVTTSHSTVTNRSLLEEFEEWCEFFIDRIISGNFKIFLNALSNFLKFVSLSLYFVELYALVLAYWLAHRLTRDDVISLVIL